MALALVIGIITTLGYFFYSGYKDQSSKDFYKTVSGSHYFYKDEPIDEKDLGDKLVKSEEGEILEKISNPALAQKVKALGLELSATDQKCKKYFKDIFDTQKIIDPNDESFKDLSKVLDVINNYTQEASFGVDFAQSTFSTFKDGLDNDMQMGRDVLDDLMRKFYICKSSDYAIFLESMMEFFQASKISQSTKDEIIKLVFFNLNANLEKSYFADNLLESLNVLRILGDYYKLDSSFFTEIETIYSAIADLEEDMESNTGAEKMSVIDYLSDYSNHYEAVADDIKFLIDRRLTQFISKE